MERQGGGGETGAAAERRARQARHAAVAGRGVAQLLGERLLLRFAPPAGEQPGRPLRAHRLSNQVQASGGRQARMSRPESNITYVMFHSS